MINKTYTTFQIAEICGVKPATIIKWVNQKKIKAYVTLGGHRRILEADLVSFLQENNFPIPQEVVLSVPQKKILVVEDEDDVGVLIKNALQKASDSVNVRWTQDGIGALLAISGDLPDLIILDVLIPVVDGIRVLATLRSDPKTRNIKVVAISGGSLSPEKLEFIRSHTDAFFQKPFDIIEFVQKSISILNLPIKEKNKPESSIRQI